MLKLPQMRGGGRHRVRVNRVAIGLATTALAAAAVITPTVLNQNAPAQAWENEGGAGNCRVLTTSVPTSVLTQQAVPLPVGLPVLGDVPLKISGRLCQPAGGAKAVMLALHGITYDESYWNAEPPVAGGDKYNFSSAMTKAGYAVFSLDRLGYGDSARPIPELVSLDVQAEVTHQIIGQLRAGKIGGAAFPYVALVGHSYGTATSWRETAKYNDADAVIGTGWGNTIQTVPLARFFSGFIPNALNPAPQAGGQVLPPGYLTPGPPLGTRDADFLYYLPNSDPAVRKYDNDVLRDTVPDGEGATFYNRYGAFPDAKFGGTAINLPLSNQTKQITVPTFQVNGQQELFFCGPNQERCTSSTALTKGESANYWTPKACFLAGVTPNAGHDLNLQKNAPFTYETIIKFADKALGPDGKNRDPYRASCASSTGQNVPADTPRFGAK